MDDQVIKNRWSFSAVRQMFSNAGRMGRIVWDAKKGSVIVLAFIFFVVSAAPFLMSGSRGFLINELVAVAGGQAVDSLLFIAVVLLIFATTVPAMLYAVQEHLTLLFWFFLEEKFELLIIQKKGEIDIAVHEDPKKSDLFNKVSENGIYRVQNFTERQFYILQNTIEVVIASAILIWSQWWIFAIIFLGTIPELLTEIRYGRMVWGIHSSRAETRRRFWDLRRHFDVVPSLVELKLFQNTHYFLSTIRELFQSFRAEEKKNERQKLWRQLLSLGLSQSVIAFATVWFVIEVMNGNLLIGTLTFVLASIGDLRKSLSGLFMNLGRQYQDSLFVTDTFELIDTEPVVKKKKKGVVLDPNVTPSIVFEDVTFAYPGTKKAILKNFSMAIPSGDKVAIVGINGAGKSTFVKLLCRFYDPDSGRITVDGHDLKDIDLESWYRQIGAIFQDYVHYHFTVKEAIAIGRTGNKTSLEKVQDAAKASEADIFIEDWEKGYKQMLGKEFSGGIEPSVGQWQKLALARTFYRDPRVLILDEPTSSIDAEAEAKIFERMEALPKDRTVILISHRFSTVRHANNIVVIKDGVVEENGTHEALLEQNGMYARLFRLQAKGYQ